MPELQILALECILKRHWKKCVLYDARGLRSEFHSVSNISPDTLYHVYENTSNDAPLRKVLVALFVDSLPPRNRIKERAANYPFECLGDVINASMHFAYSGTIHYVHRIIEDSETSDKVRAMFTRPSDRISTATRTASTDQIHAPPHMRWS